MPGIEKEDWVSSWRAWLQGCQGLKNKPDWQAVCSAAVRVNAEDAAAIQAYWQQYFNVYQTQQSEGARQGLMTGYYQPVLKGARVAGPRYTVPLYQTPPDLITVNLSRIFPDLK